MTTKERNRLKMLRLGPQVDSHYLIGYYGLHWPLSEPSRSAFHRVIGSTKRSAHQIISRYDLETYMLRSRLVPRKWMGAQLGMSEESLALVLPKLGEFGMQKGRYEVGEEFVATSLPEDLVRLVPGLGFRAFSPSYALPQQKQPLRWRRGRFAWGVSTTFQL